MRKSFALIPVLLLGACSTVEEAVMGPQLSDMGYPAALVPLEQSYSPTPPQPGSAGSLWRAGSRSFFRDQRAHEVGDILTINIDIDDRASLQNSTARDRSAETQAGVGSFFGIVRPNDISSQNTIDHTQIAEARISYGGRGDVSRVQGPPASQSIIERFSPF